MIECATWVQLPWAAKNIVLNVNYNAERDLGEIICPAVNKEGQTVRQIKS